MQVAQDQISFDDAEKIVLEHGQQFGRPGVIGVGIAERHGKIQFIVGVKNEATRQEIAQEYANKTAGGFPVYPEIKNLVPLDADLADITSDTCAVQPTNPVQWVLDRPGLLVLAAITLVVVAFFVIR